MRIKIAKEMTGKEKIDLLTGYYQIFQDSPPDISPFIASKRIADVYLIPHDALLWDSGYVKYVKSLALDSTVLYFNRGDHPIRYKIDNAFSIQSTSFGNLPGPTIIVPYNVKKLGLKTLRRHKDMPVVSFVGFVPTILSRRISENGIDSCFHPLMSNPGLIRKSGINQIQRKFHSGLVIQRHHYGGSARLIENPEIFRTQFLNSVYESDFVFSPRGDANGSQRFYEALSAGRLPIVPSSCVKLPKTFEAPWSGFFLTCKTLSGNLADVVLNFWADTNSEEYASLQIANARFFEDVLDYRTYINNIMKAELSDLESIAYR